jgi:hypothetical protein
MRWGTPTNTVGGTGEYRLPWRRSGWMQKAVFVNRAHVRSWLKADLPKARIDVCYSPNGGHFHCYTRLPVLTLSGRRTKSNWAVYATQLFYLLLFVRLTLILRERFKFGDYD